MLERALAKIRVDGYAVSVDEAVPGVVSVAAPLFDGAGDCIAAMSVAGPVSRMPPDKVEQVVRLVVRAAASVAPGRDARSA
jgi:DNA-binding IclR family transcriptional regulator